MRPDVIRSRRHRVGYRPASTGKFAANPVLVDLTCDPEGAKLRIKDDGRGFDPQTVPAGHMGVSIMRERAQDVGADIEIVSEFGSGTQVRVSWSAAENES